MALIHQDTREVMKSELELFQLYPTQTSIEETRYEKYFPQTSLDRGGPLDFNIPTNDEEYIDPQYIFLYTEMRILNENGEAPAERVSADNAAIPPKSVVFPINYFHATCFKSVDVHINNKSCSSNDTLYPYRAYFETLLSLSKPMKNEQAKTGMYYKDTNPIDEHSNAVTKTGANASKNSGAQSRFLRTRFGQRFETFGRLHTDITSQGRLLVGNVELNIRLHRADAKFCLMAAEEQHRYTISIDKAALFVCHKKISDSIREAHQITLQKTPFKYPIRKVQMKFFTRGSNRSDLTEPNLVNGVLPRKIVIGLTDSLAFHGSYHHSPFNFQHFDVTSIVLRKNGAALPFQELEMNYEDNCHLQGYLSLLEGTNNLFRDSSIDVQPYLDFPHGYAVYAFDLTADHGGGCNYQLIKQGNVSLEVKLAKPQDKGITIVCYLEYDGLIQIDKDNIVTYE